MVKQKMIKHCENSVEFKFKLAQTKFLKVFEKLNFKKGTIETYKQCNWEKLITQTPVV